MYNVDWNIKNIFKWFNDNKVYIVLKFEEMLNFSLKSPF